MQTDRMKFEDEKYWEIEKRISNWKQYNDDSSKKVNNNFYVNR
jgi:hypothetical protein